MKYLHIGANNKATIYKKDSSGKIYAIASEDTRVSYYRKTHMDKNSVLIPIDVGTIAEARQKYPEEFL